MRNYKGYQRVLSFLLSFLMAFTSIPITAFANEGIEDSPPLEEPVSHYLYIDQQQEFGTIFDTDDEKEYLEIFEKTEEEPKPSEETEAVEGDTSSLESEAPSEPTEPILLYLNTEYNVGDEIKLQVNIEDGYEVGEFKVQEWIPEPEGDEIEGNLNSEDIVEPQMVEHVYDAETGILTFVMPEFDVLVVASFVEKIELGEPAPECDGGIHDYYGTKVEPTCTSQGFTTNVCLNCGDKYISEKTDMLTHEYDEFITKQATETENGEKTFICYMCGDTYTEVIPVTGSSQNNVITNPKPDIVAPVEGESTSKDVYIRELSTELFYGAEKSGNDYVWNVMSSTKGHMFSFRINYAISGVDVAPENTVRFSIPKSILKNRDGNSSDTYDMSIPSKSRVDEFLNGIGEVIESDVGFGYYENGDEIIIYNFRELPAGYNGFIELSYISAEPSYRYVDMAKQSPFTCTMTVPRETKTASPITVKINTTASIISTNKRYPTKYTSWQSTWGTEVKPANADNYHYLLWTIESEIEATQLYNFILNDSVVGNYGGMTVIGYKFLGQSTFTASNTARNQSLSQTRYDYVLTAIPLSAYGNKTYWEANNTITSIVDPVDQVDADTRKTSIRKWTWTKPVFTVPEGHVNVYKRADASHRSLCMFNLPMFWNTTHRALKLDFNCSEYTRYDLESFNGYNDIEITANELNGFKYASWIVGYPYPWTYDSSYNNPLNPEAYGKLPVRYELIDEGIQLTNETENEAEFSEMLTSEDFRFESLGFSWYMTDAVFDEDTQNFKENQVVYTEDDIIVFYGKFGVSTEWVQFATYNLYTKESIFDSTYVETMTDNNIVFKDDVDMVAYKLETTNAHYYTELFTVPHLTLKNSQRVMNYVTGKPAIGILNHNYGNFYEMNKGESPDTLFAELQSQSTEFARVSQRYSDLMKNIISVSNNPEKKFYTISWKINQSETMEWGEDGITEILPQNGGTFYDLLPEGAKINIESIDVENRNGNFLSKSSYDVAVIDNYKNSGRTMLIVKIKVEADFYVLYYDTIHHWNDIKDYGNDVYNPVAYETGNETITNGFPDNGGQYFADGTQNPNAIKDAILMSNLNNEIDDTTSKKFIYTEKYYDIATITAASAGLTKKVKSEKSSIYTYEDFVSNNGLYSYQLRFMNSQSSSAKNMIFFDSLENYDYDTMMNYGTISDWRGTLQGVDVNQLKQKGINPVIYYSTISYLDIETNNDITDTSIWKVLTDNTDLSTVKAIAIDMSESINGESFVLNAGDSVVATLYMKAPAEAEAKNEYARTYNNIYIQNTVFDPEIVNSEQNFLIHQDYTTLKFITTGNFGIEKVSEESNDTKIKDIEFRLIGTSAYGTEIDEVVITDVNGQIYFKDIEMGSYILQEYKSTDDWLLDTTEHRVVIDNLGKVWIDDVEYTENYVTITNKPRIHGDLSFYKKELGDDTTGIPNTTFLLSGISDYGTEILMYATSKQDGRVSLENIELGTYELIEVAANPNYQLNNIIYKVKVTEAGTVHIVGSNEVDAEGIAVPLESSAWFKRGGDGIEDDIYNAYRYYGLELRKVDEENPTIFLEGATFLLSGVSDLNTKIEMLATSNTNGYVIFKDVEPGIYLLKETVAPQNIDELGNIGGTLNYKIDLNEYFVKIDYLGNVTIEGLEQEAETGYFIVKNSRAYDKEIVITKIWNDGLTNEERLANGIIPKLHLTTKVPSEEESMHVHTWNAGTILSEANCVKGGEVLFACTSCGETKLEKTAALDGHPWDAGAVIFESTCVEQGQMLFTCTSCTETKVENLPLLPHIEGETINGVPYCSVCENPIVKFGSVVVSKKCADATVSVYEDDYDYYAEGLYPSKVIAFIPAESNTYNFKAINVDGEDIVVSLYDNEMNLLLSLDDWGDEGEIFDFDCVAGNIYYLAVGFYNINYVYSNDITVSIHTWDDGEIILQPTCTETGETLYTCTTCQKTRTEEIRALNHSYVDGNVISEPTCTTAGSKERICSRCQSTTTASISALGHRYLNETCSGCGRKTAKMTGAGSVTLSVSTSDYDYKSSSSPYYSKLITFIPSESGTYTFAAESSTDTYGRLYDANMKSLDYDDDDGTGSNFSITYNCTAGITYYLAAGYYSSRKSGDIPVTIIKTS